LILARNKAWRLIPLMASGAGRGICRCNQTRDILIQADRAACWGSRPILPMDNLNPQHQTLTLNSKPCTWSSKGHLPIRGQTRDILTRDLEQDFSIFGVVVRAPPEEGS
jgi:hypothetical protein